MTSASQSPNLGEAARRFLATLTVGGREASQPEVYKFVRWYGGERPFSELTAPEVANYAEQLSVSDTDFARRLELVRTFLVYARKEGWTRTNLAVHLKARKGKARLSSLAGPVVPEAIPLTQRGYAELEAELASLKSQRAQVIDEMRRAAADKDFRENAPLEAAREQRGHLEGRIKELEATLKVAFVIGEKVDTTLKAGIGDKIVLCDLASGEELSYMIVSSTEIDLTRGKISSVSPLGKALIGRCQGEIIGLTVPAGKLRYQIKQIKH